MTSPRADRRLTVLKAILAFGIVSTGLHYTHNYVEVDRYPTGSGITEEMVKGAILVSWPLFTAIAVFAYRAYRRGALGDAHALLLIYSVAGLSTPFHFVNGNPDIGALWYATIFTDGLAGLAAASFAIASMLRRRRERYATSTGVPTLTRS